MKTQLISKLVSALLLAVAPSAFAQRAVMVNSNNSVVVFPTNLWSANASEIRSGLGLSTTVTNSVIPVVSGGTGATNAAGARTNLGLGASWLTNTDVTNFRTAIGVGATWLTNTNVTNFTTAIGLGATNNVRFNSISVYLDGEDESSIAAGVDGLVFKFGTNSSFELGGGTEVFYRVPIRFNNSINSATTRTNLGLGATWLTNTNTTNFLAALFGANTNPVLVNTNGIVVSPTNFWSYAPGAVIIQDFTTNVLTSTTNSVTNARNVFVYSFTTNVTGATHTLELPTNASSGDFVTVTHTGPTSSITAVRAAGTTNNIVSLSQVDEQVRFVYRNSAWRIEPPRALTTPLYFSGSSATANAAASRTNLGVPLAALTNTNNATFRSAIEIPLAALTNTNNATFRAAIDLPWSGLTNTNETTFQAAIFTNTNTAPSVTTNFAGWISIKVGTLTNNFRVPVYQ